MCCLGTGRRPSAGTPLTRWRLRPLTPVALNQQWPFHNTGCFVNFAPHHTHHAPSVRQPCSHVARPTAVLFKETALNLHLALPPFSVKRCTCLVSLAWIIGRGGGRRQGCSRRLQGAKRCGEERGGWQPRCVEYAVHAAGHRGRGRSRALRGLAGRAARPGCPRCAHMPRYSARKLCAVKFCLLQNGGLRQEVGLLQ